MSHVRHSLDPIFHPRSVAVLGASDRPGSVGSILMRNLLGNPFGGVVYPINPKRQAVHGVSCYPDLASVPDVVGPGRHRHAGRDRAGPDRRMRRRVACRRRSSSRLASRNCGAEGRALETADSRHCPGQDAHHRPELPGRHSSPQQPQRQLRRGHGPARTQSPCSASPAPSARRSSTGRASARRLQHLRQRRGHARRRFRRPDRLLRRRSEHAQHHAVHGIDRRRAQVPVRGPLDEPDQAGDRGEVRPARSRGPRRGLAHRSAGRGRRRLRRGLPPGRRAARDHHSRPVQHVGDPGHAAAAARPGPGADHQRRRPRRDGRRTP